MKVSSFVSVFSLIGVRGTMISFDSSVFDFRRNIFDKVNKLDVFSKYRKR